MDFFDILLQPFSYSILCAFHFILHLIFLQTRATIKKCLKCGVDTSVLFRPLLQEHCDVALSALFEKLLSIPQDMRPDLVPQWLYENQDIKMRTKALCSDITATHPILDCIISVSIYLSSRCNRGLCFHIWGWIIEIPLFWSPFRVKTHQPALDSSPPDLHL